MLKPNQMVPKYLTGSRSKDEMIQASKSTSVLSSF